MGRWEPGARIRLQAAAMELYAARGYEATTVADIAGRAGLTERTFFRYFPDKREVLFDGAQQLQDRFVSTVAAHPPGRGALNAVHAAVSAAAEVMQQGREQASRRAVVIAGDPVLQERELIKLASLAAALARTLRERGVGEPAASLTAEVGVAVFRVAFERWLEGPADELFTAHIEQAFAALRAVADG